MRPQARPFAVEFRRKRTPQPARPASRRDEWLDTRPPDINEGSSNEPRREAERVFQRLQGSAGHATEQASVSLGIAPAAAPAHPSRVLPDLLTAAREEQRQIAEKPQRSRRAKSPPANRPTKGQPEAAPSLPIIAVAVGKNISLSSKPSLSTRPAAVWAGLNGCRAVRDGRNADCLKSVGDVRLATIEATDCAGCIKISGLTW